MRHVNLRLVGVGLFLLGVGSGAGLRGVIPVGFLGVGLVLDDFFSLDGLDNCCLLRRITFMNLAFPPLSLLLRVALLPLGDGANDLIFFFGIRPKSFVVFFFNFLF